MQLNFVCLACFLRQPATPRAAGCNLVCCRLPPDVLQASVKRFTRFHSQSPPQQIVRQIAEVLEMQEIKHEVRSSNFKIKISHKTDRGPLTCTVQAARLLPT